MEQAVISEIRERAELLLNALFHKRIYRIKEIFIKLIYQGYFKEVERRWKLILKKQGKPLFFSLVSLGTLEDDEIFYYYCEYCIEFKESKLNCSIYLNLEYSIENFSFCECIEQAITNDKS